MDLTPAQEAVLRKPHGTRQPLVRRGGARAAAQRHPGSGVRRRRARRAPSRPDGSTHASPRCGGATSIASPTAPRSATRCSGTARRGCRRTSMSRRWTWPLTACSACTTSPATARRGRARRPSARCSRSPGVSDADGVLVADLRRTPSATAWSARWSAPASRWGRASSVPGDLVALRDERRRTSAFKVMPARGLTLLEVGLPGRSRARAARGADPGAARAVAGLTGVPTST